MFKMIIYETTTLTGTMSTGKVCTLSRFVHLSSCELMHRLHEEVAHRATTSTSRKTWRNTFLLHYFSSSSYCSYSASTRCSELNKWMIDYSRLTLAFICSTLVSWVIYSHSDTVSLSVSSVNQSINRSTLPVINANMRDCGCVYLLDLQRERTFTLFNFFLLFLLAFAFQPITLYVDIILSLCLVSS